jgi:ABC-type cobalamin/Fe3+-siderophores transport system ATPase subunit
MLSSIRLKFTQHPELVLPVNGITIFVGPNNSGKSLVLKEIESAFNTHPFPAGTLMLSDYEVKWLDDVEIDNQLTKLEQYADPNVPIGHRTIGRLNPNGGREATHINIDHLKNIAKNKTEKNWWATQFLKWGVLRLDGRSRFNLTNDQAGGDLLAAPANVLAHLFQNDAARKKVRELIKDAFGLTFAIDPTSLGQLRIRLSREDALTDEQSLNQTARDFYRKALHIKDASDGVQAFTGIVTAVMSGEFHTILIDEPEAFLHPPLARKLGTSLANLATQRSGALLASTHSSDFLMGCVQATKDVRVVRLEYTEGKSQGRVVDPAELEKLFKSPLMRSANAISGLFYDGVVVTESDNDRAFYGEIYHRLASIHKDYPSILFINAQNKQTIKNIIGPLRKFGVPAAAIPDIDILKDGGRTWTEWLASAHIPEALHTGFGHQRLAIKDRFDAAGKDMKADGGVDALPVADKQAADQLFQTLADYGIFVVRGGELEDWLAPLGVPGKKTEWTVAMLERLGSDPIDPNYVPPGTDDVWAFIASVVQWVRNAARKGTS